MNNISNWCLFWKLEKMEINHYKIQNDEMGKKKKYTLGPFGPPLQSGVLVVLQSAQNFLITPISSYEQHSC